MHPPVTREIGALVGKAASHSSKTALSFWMSASAMMDQIRTYYAHTRVIKQ
jgi:hypothetical protein